MLEIDFNEYLTEYRLQTPAAEPISHYEDGELEAEWLISAGFPQLTRAFEEGRELSSNELTASVAGLPKFHAEAVKQRVKALNRTVRGRTRSRHPRKPDIRDVFRDVDASSTGTRSRSATPDSLDSLPGEDNWHSTPIPSFVSVFDNPVLNAGRSKQNLRRTPSAPLRGSNELFRGSHIRCDIPFYSAEGIELLNYQKLGTIYLPRIRSGSDPSCSIGKCAGIQITGAHSHNNLYNRSSDSSNISSSPDHSPVNSPLRHSLLSQENSPRTGSSPEPVSFENMCRDTSSPLIISQIQEWNNSLDDEPGCDVANLTDLELKKLQPLLWLELASLFDRHQVTLDKRKPFKRKRKEEGNVFGISLNALVRRDQQVTGEDSSLVPLLLQSILRELTNRGAKEEGILRVPGNKQKTELLYTELEQNFYSKYETIDPYLKRAGVHDLSALLKRWLRELPIPLLANDLIHLFYQTHAIPPPDQYKAISVLCLLLPHENRNTLRAFLKFLKHVISLEDLNKMSKHNVATIIAPSLFPPRFVHPVDKNDIGAQVRVAAQCCKLTDVLITQFETLWMVPQRLIEQARTMSGKPGGGMGKRQIARKTKSVTNSATDPHQQQHHHHHHHHLHIPTHHINVNHIHKFVI